MNKYEEQNISPLIIDDLIKQFKMCGIKEGQTISVHSSLCKLGWVVGGAETLIRVEP